ncbi:MAG: family 78 glycoside hydrolase catalytic domain [Terrimicrobiaceae bacterium]
MWLHLFADSRYRLRVNGRWVAAGPARFVTQYPEYDTHDLSPWLVVGVNTIEVEVNYFGTSSYQTMPDGRPGFIAWGNISGIDLATPGDWEAELCREWRQDAPLFSFAQNPVEICDTRLDGAARRCALRVLEGNDAPWGKLTPYSGRPLRGKILRPRRIEVVGPLANHEKLLGFMTHYPGSAGLAGQPPPWVAFATWIWSPRAQDVLMSCFWGELECNGDPVHVDTSTPRGNHGEGILRLRSGWNFLAGKLEVLTEVWAWCIGVPEDSGLLLRSCKDAACETVFAISPLGNRDELVLPHPGDTAPPAHWQLSDGNPAALTPARVMGWDCVSSDVVKNLPAQCLSKVAVVNARAATWCFSFDGEFLGYIRVEVEGPPGTVVDIGYDDWQSPTGGLALYRSNPFTDAADRFILRGGRQTIEGFHPRGGKLVQITMRAPGEEAAPLGLHDLHFLSRQSFEGDETRFSCDHTELEWAWPTAFRTLVSSTDEAFTDCPWRERASYIGDTLVSIHLNSLLNPDMRTARRVLRLFSQSRLPGGQLPCCAPSWLRKPHEDFTLLWLVALHDYWAVTGDISTVWEVWPTVAEILGADALRTQPGELEGTEGRRLFIDWGVLAAERGGRGNAVLNILRVAARRAASALAKAGGHFPEAARWSQEADSLESTIARNLWSEKHGRFLAAMDLETPALHANTLALAFKIGDKSLRSRVLDYLEPALRDNFRQGIAKGQFSGHLELYFFHYLLPALAEHGRPDLAELLIAEHYQYLRLLGDDTLPECFCRVEQGVGSRCHSWSGAAAIYAARYVLGIRPATPGKPHEMIFHPVVSGISRASGRIAHPMGWIDVRWERVEGCLHSQIRGPDGMTITDASESRSNPLAMADVVSAR